MGDAKPGPKIWDEGLEVVLAMEIGPDRTAALEVIAKDGDWTNNTDRGLFLEAAIDPGLSDFARCTFLDQAVEKMQQGMKPGRRIRYRWAKGRFDEIRAVFRAWGY